ncbi:MAG: HNH endonuclease [Anaeromyxobacteraceae bacterium]
MVPGWNIPEVGTVSGPGGPLGGDGLASLAAYRSALDLIEVPAPTERKFVDREAAALLIDALSVRIARGRGALDLAIGQKLGELWNVSGELDLGYSQVHDLAREKLGMTASFARRLLRLERNLRERPLLRAALFAGEVTRSKAEVVMKRAKGEEEARWVEAARQLTVRQLVQAVKDVPKAASPVETVPKETVSKEAVSEEAVSEESASKESPAGAPVEPGAVPPVDENMDELPWRHLRLWLGKKAAPIVRAAIDLARYLDEAPRTIPECLRLMAMEYLSSHAAPEVPEGQKPSPEYLGQPYELRPELRELLEKQSNGWAFLFKPLAVAAPALEPTWPPDAYGILDELRGLMQLRNAWDEELGRVLLRLKTLGLWRTMMFASFEHYADERLGLGASNLKQRIALEKRLTDLPPLREAMRSGKLSYEQARLVAKDATAEDVEAKIAEAAGKTCLALQREVEGKEEGQMWDAGFLDVPVPEEVDSLLAEAVRAARKAAGRWLSTEDALEAIARHCLDTWTPLVERKLKDANPVMVRDGGLCTTPGCSRVGDDVHHIKFRSQGGDDSPENQTGMCKPHHLRGVHGGNVLVTGSAPDKLTWVLGWREVAAAKGH